MNATAQHYKMTKLEEWVWRNRGLTFAQMATQLNRTEKSMAAAYKRAEAKYHAQTK
jgi:hypothetical protein